MSTIKLQNLPQYEGTVRATSKLFVYDEEAGILKHCDASQLPIPEGGSGDPQTVLPAEINIINSSDGYSTVNDSGVISAVISDARLVGHSGYSVRTTQLNIAAFRSYELEYDEALGKVKILGFVLNSGEEIIIAAPGVTGSGSNSGSLTTIQEDIAELKRITAPFKPTALGSSMAYVWYFGDLDRLATDMPGWQVVTGLEGRTLIVVDPNDPDFVFGATGGRKAGKLTAANMVKHKHFTVSSQNYSGPNFPGAVGRAISAVRSMISYWSKSDGAGKESYVLYGTSDDNEEPDVSPTSSFGETGSALEAINFMNPYKTGYLLEYLGV